MEGGGGGGGGGGGEGNKLTVPETKLNISGFLVQTSSL